MAGNLLNQYNSLRSKQNDDQFETVYPNHLRDFLPVFEINSGKFLQLLLLHREGTRDNGEQIQSFDLSSLVNKHA